MNALVPRLAPIQEMTVILDGAIRMRMVGNEYLVNIELNKYDIFSAWMLESDGAWLLRYRELRPQNRGGINRRENKLTFMAVRTETEAPLLLQTIQAIARCEAGWCDMVRSLVEEIRSVCWNVYVDDEDDLHVERKCGSCLVQAEASCVAIYLKAEDPGVFGSLMRPDGPDAFVMEFEGERYPGAELGEGGIYTFVFAFPEDEYEIRTLAIASARALAGFCQETQD